MCATCGCSTSAVVVTDLQTGTHEHLGAGAHEHPHDHLHSHPHSHSHSHTHSHSHAHAHVHEAPGDGPVHRHEPGGHPEAHESAPASGGGERIRLERDLLAGNDRRAAQNRGWLAGRGVTALNIMSSPGAGKTTLLERTIRDLGHSRVLQVVEGDQATLRDAERIRAAGGRVVQINTGAGCHLDAEMVARALSRLDPVTGSLVLIENVGNLVCPALFELGEGARVVVASVTEGDDKPEKYPHMFRAADLILLNKIDLLPHVQFDPGVFEGSARALNPNVQCLRISATRGDGLPAWYEWLTSPVRQSA